MKSPIKLTFMALILSVSFTFVGIGQTKLSLTTGEWAPFTSEKLEGLGFITEIVTAVTAEMDIVPDYKFYPWKRAELMVDTSKAWAAFPYAKNDERSKKHDFSDAVASSSLIFFYYKPVLKQFEYTTLEALKDYTIGGNPGYTYENAVKKANLNVQWVTGEESNFKKLAKGKVQLTIQNELVGWTLIKKLFPDKVHEFATAKKPYEESAMYLMVSREYPNSKQILKSFNDGLKAIKTKGIFQNIYKKYNLTFRE